MWQLGLKTSDVIAVAALIVAFIIGALNYWHTRRQFRASHYPAIHIGLVYDCGLFNIDQLFYNIQNLSDKYSVAEVRVSISVTKKPFLWDYPGKWKKLFPDEVIDVIKPGEVKGKRIGFFSISVGQTFPDIVGRKSDSDSTESSAILILKNHPLGVRLSVSCRPGIIGAKLFSVTKLYKAESTFESREGAEYHLTFQEIL